MEHIEVTVDKFVFRVAPEYRYGDSEVWAAREGARIRVGLTDYMQQKSGDVAFVNLKAVGTVLAANDELAAVETIKVDLVIPAPLAGTIAAINPALAAQPELVNGDPYGEGWLAEIEPASMAHFEALSDARAYAAGLQTRAEMELNK